MDNLIEKIYLNNLKDEDGDDDNIDLSTVLTELEKLNKKYPNAIIHSQDGCIAEYTEVFNYIEVYKFKENIYIQLTYDVPPED